MSPPSNDPRGARLNVGCGNSPLPGWVNVDLQLLPGVDVVADVSSGLCFRSVAVVFAEHFLEHLALDEAFAFLEDAHRVLGREGWLRLSTPNLEWVLATHYDREAPLGKDRGTFQVNRAFYGWEHRFLWDRSFLERTMVACGFTDLRWPAYGESSLAFFRGLEGHERSADSPGLPHVLIVEARKGPARPELLAELRRLAQEQFLGQMEEARLRRARLEVKRLCREIERLHGVVGRLDGEIKRLHGEVGRLDGEYRQCAGELAETRAQHDVLRLRHEEAMATLRWMEASRFWKARNVWFRFKESVGLVRREP
jgi:hypothetical protein